LPLLHPLSIASWLIGKMKMFIDIDIHYETYGWVIFVSFLNHQKILLYPLPKTTLQFSVKELMAMKSILRFICLEAVFKFKVLTTYCWN
jgi:hypothetical protein